MYSLPEYDGATDTFKDGVLPKDVDSYFDKAPEKQTHYSWEFKIKIFKPNYIN